MTPTGEEQSDKERIRRLEIAVAEQKRRLDGLEQTVSVLERQILALSESEEIAAPR